MDSVATALDRIWPSELRTDRLLLRPVTTEDGLLVHELLTDDRVRAHLGGPVTEDRVAARQAAYPTTAGAFTVVRVADQRPIGLVTIAVDHRCEGRAELSYQLLPAAWGEGLGREAVAAAVSWWTDAVPGGGPLVAVTQKANSASCRLLEAIGMTVVDELDEHGARQCLYTPAGDKDDSDLRWLRLLAARRDAVERRRGAQARATAAGQNLPDDLAALTPEELVRLCPARHGAYGRICARMADHAGPSPGPGTGRRVDRLADDG
ncbi:GNAT family N-acetyltransferase [Streptomyces sp. AS58]|uniref:GNAT family N-acetyltransferase n=1 Tax=Streptomyces sp. AS58 TaxID=1519489 RepID=UPI0006AEC809|nr:GNAT family N-acetyltransferase [Streptomyces sp. AS58]